MAAGGGDVVHVQVLFVGGVLLLQGLIKNIRMVPDLGEVVETASAFRETIFQPQNCPNYDQWIKGKLSCMSM